MSARKNSRKVSREHPDAELPEYASIGRSSGHQGLPSTGHSRHRDATPDGAQPRFRPEELSGRRHRDESPLDAVPTLDRQDRHATSRDRAGLGRSIGSQHEDTDSDSEHRRNYQVENRAQVGQRTSRPVLETRPREATAAPRVHVTENIPPERSIFQSRLGQLARLFASIEEDEYALCRDFIVQRPEILEENENDFIKDAVIALASRQSEGESRAYARRCIQQSLILRQCKKQDRKGREKFFALLEEEEKKTSLDFLNESDAVFDRCLEKARELQDAIPNRAPRVVGATISTQRITSDTRHDARADGLSRGISTLSVEFSGNQRHGPTSSDAVPYPRPLEASGDRQERRRRASTATAGSNPNAGATINRSGLLRTTAGTVIGGTTGEQEELDASYYKRERAAGFFVKGRVFALLWHEGAGESDNDRFSEIAFRGRFNEPIISHIRRMVVVVPGQGNCWAIPINTYRGHGVAKRGFKQVDIDGHAVIHASTAEPYTSPREPIMRKEPLKVNMVQGERLDPMSRINFTTVHTVQHNVKVKNIGMIHPDSKVHLTDYWNAQVAA